MSYNVELGPMYADASGGGGGGGYGDAATPGASCGSKPKSASRFKSRAHIDPSQPPEQEPVVVNVPLPDLNRPIVAHLDANHQIVGTRDEAGGGGKPMHI